MSYLRISFFVALGFWSLQEKYGNMLEFTNKNNSKVDCVKSYMSYFE